MRRVLSIAEKTIFSPIPIREAADAAGQVCRDELRIRFSDPDMGGSLNTLAARMSCSACDPICGINHTRDRAHLRAFTIGLAPEHDDDTLLALLSLGIQAFRTGEMRVTISAVFTDANWRGEGFSRLLSCAAKILIKRCVVVWSDMPGSCNSDLQEITVEGQPLSDGGADFIDRVAEGARELMLEHHHEHEWAF